MTIEQSAGKPVFEQLNWIPVTVRLPEKAGWYLACTLPNNYKDLSFDSMKGWLDKFTVTITWVNVTEQSKVNKYPEAIDKCKFYKQYGNNSHDVSKTVVTWAEKIVPTDYSIIERTAEDLKKMWDDPHDFRVNALRMCSEWHPVTSKFPDQWEVSHENVLETIKALAGAGKTVLKIVKDNIKRRSNGMYIKVGDVLEKIESHQVNTMEDSLFYLMKTLDIYMTEIEDTLKIINNTVKKGEKST
jgi:hypothetical protein